MTEDNELDTAGTVISKGMVTFTAIPYPISPENQHRLKACFDSPALLRAVDMKIRASVGVKVTRPKF